MDFSSDLSTSEEYKSFRSSVPLKKLSADVDPKKIWKIYDAGPKTVQSPLVCLAPVSGTADIFYKQILYLTARGIRVLSVESPIYWSVDDWCEGFKRLLDELQIDTVHIFGASLGGFLAQKFVEYTYDLPRVASVILCNSFCDTSIFNNHESAALFWILPGPILKKIVAGNILSQPLRDLSMANAAAFMLERLESLSQQEIASRLTLNCVNGHVDTFKVTHTTMTIVDVFDDSALSAQARDELKANYTNAKLAHLKTGGDFPYLSRADEVNMHIFVHLRGFSETKYSAQKALDSPVHHVDSSELPIAEEAVEVSRGIDNTTDE